MDNIIKKQCVPKFWYRRATIFNFTVGRVVNERYSIEILKSFYEIKIARKNIRNCNSFNTPTILISKFILEKNVY
jgi:hypothetical protein